MRKLGATHLHLEEPVSSPAKEVKNLCATRHEEINGMKIKGSGSWVQRFEISSVEGGVSQRSTSHREVSFLSGAQWEPEDMDL